MNETSKWFLLSLTVDWKLVRFLYAIQYSIADAIDIFIPKTNYENNKCLLIQNVCIFILLDAFMLMPLASQRVKRFLRYFWCFYAFNVRLHCTFVRSAFSKIYYNLVFDSNRLTMLLWFSSLQTLDHLPSFIFYQHNIQYLTFIRSIQRIIWPEFKLRPSNILNGMWWIFGSLSFSVFECAMKRISCSKKKHTYIVKKCNFAHL